MVGVARRGNPGVRENRRTRTEPNEWEREGIDLHNHSDAFSCTCDLSFCGLSFTMVIGLFRYSPFRSDERIPLLLGATGRSPGGSKLRQRRGLVRRGALRGQRGVFRHQQRHRRRRSCRLGLLPRRGIAIRGKGVRVLGRRIPPSPSAALLAAPVIEGAAPTAPARAARRGRPFRRRRRRRYRLLPAAHLVAGGVVAAILVRLNNQIKNNMYAI